MDLGKVIRELEVELDEDLMLVPARSPVTPQPAPEPTAVPAAVP